MFRLHRFYRQLTTQADLVLQKTLKDSLKHSMKQKDKFTVTVIKSVLADITNEEKSGVEKKMSVSELIQRGIKKRNDAILLYKQGGRDDLVEQEKKEVQVLESFLPKQLSPDEIRTVVLKVVGEMNATTKDFGKVMKVLNEQIDSAVASRKSISEIVKDVLAGK